MSSLRSPAGITVTSCALIALLVLAMGSPALADEERSGPRDLPTFVDLELDGFPCPAEDACAQPARVVDVAPPASISEALGEASPGTVIHVAPGTYVENPADPTAITWLADGVCLLGANGADEVVIEAAPGQRYGIDLRGDSSVLAGVTLRGFEAAIGLWSPEGQTQRAITIEDTRIEDFRGAQREGIVAYGDNRSVAGRPPTVDGLLVLDVRIEGVDMGVSCNAGPCEHWWIERTSVSGRRGSGSSGADAFAVEDGRQVVIVDSVAHNVAADGIDLKADDVVIMGARVLDVGRNAIKLWRGGDVLDSVVDGSGADAALVGDGAGRYRYAHVLVTHHDPGGSGYVGWWAYDAPADIDLEIVDSVFVDNASGGLFARAGARVRIEHSAFADRGVKLLERGGRTWMTEDIAALEAAGLGSGNLSGDHGALPRLGARGGQPARGRRDGHSRARSGPLGPAAGGGIEPGHRTRGAPVGPSRPGCHLRSNRPRQWCMSPSCHGLDAVADDVDAKRPSSGCRGQDTGWMHEGRRPPVSERHP